MKRQPLMRVARRHAIGFAALFLAISGTAIAAKVPTNSVGTAQLKSDSVGAAEIKNNAIRSAHLAVNSVQSAHVAPGVISSSHVLDNSLTIGDFAEGTFNQVGQQIINDYFSEAFVDTHDIVDDAVTNQKVAPSAITGVEVMNNSLSGADILDGSVTLADLADGIGGTIPDLSITTPKLANQAVTTAKLADVNVTTGKLADQAVTIAKLADASVTNVKLGPNAVTGDKILDQAVSAADIANAASGSDAVNADQLDGLNSTQFQREVTQACSAASAIRAINDDGTVACEAVTAGGSIPDNSVSTLKLQDLAVTAAKIADLAVNSAKLGNNSVISAKIADRTVAPADLSIVPAVSVQSTALSGVQLSMTEVFDTASMFNPASPLQITVPLTGLYQVNYTLKLDDTGRLTAILSSVRRNGTAMPQLGIRDSIEDISKTTNTSGLVALTAGDIIDVTVVPGIGAPPLVEAYFQMNWVGHAF